MVTPLEARKIETQSPLCRIKQVTLTLQRDCSLQREADSGWIPRTVDGDSLRIVIVADDPLARAGLVTLLEGQEGCAVVGQVALGADWPADLDLYRPDVVVCDLGWDSAAGALDALREGVELAFSSGEGGVPLVALVGDEDAAAEVWAVGVQGVLPRQVEGDRLRAALVAAAHGVVVLDGALADLLLPTAPPPDLPPGQELTPRELEVLQLLAEGLANKAIALQLGISEHTVKFHVNAILAKLGAQSRTQAVVRATRLGLIIL
jgi:two-component system nitrate/nitrite response regulator NarL